MKTLMNPTSLFDSLFYENSPAFFVRPLHGDPLPNTNQIKLDVTETERQFTIHAEIPGVNKNDIHVDIDGNRVTVRAEIKQQDQETQSGKVLRSERFYGAMARSLQLPLEVDAETARASYEKGILTLALPKKSASNARRLTVD